MKKRQSHIAWADAPEHTPRVLLECPPEQSPDIIAALIERRGYAVRTCIGPEARHHCELVDDGACSLIDGADVVVNMLGARREPGRSVADAVSTQRRPPELIVAVAQPHIPVVDLGLTPDEVIATSMSSDQLFDAIDAALARRERAGTWWGAGES